MNAPIRKYNPNMQRMPVTTVKDPLQKGAKVKVSATKQDGYVLLPDNVKGIYRVRFPDGTAQNFTRKELTFVSGRVKRKRRKVGVDVGTYP